jgi:transposase
MSSTSFLYHAYGLKEVDYVKTEYKEGKVYFTVQTKAEALCCSACGSKDVVKKGYLERSFKALPIGFREVIIIGRIQRLACKECGVIRQEKLAYADLKKLSPINWSVMR